MTNKTSPRQLKPVFTWARSFAEAEAEDKAFWWSQTPQARLRHLEELRRLNYGHARTTARLQRAIEFAQCSWR
jgi:hypothetical protein